MKESDKGWKSSRKLQAAIFSAFVILAIYVDNRGNVTIADHVITICELVIIGAFGGRIGMSVTQDIMGGASEMMQRVDPKDVDGLPE